VGNNNARHQNNMPKGRVTHSQAKYTQHATHHAYQGLSDNSKEHTEESDRTKMEHRKSRPAVFYLPLLTVTRRGRGARCLVY
jgi:hypothetical protein